MSGDNKKIKVTELAITNGKEIIIRTDDTVAPIKLYRLKNVIEEWINRDMYEIAESTIEFTSNDGKKYIITAKDLDVLFRAAYPEFFNNGR